MNSFKSACSFAKSTPVSLNQLEENIEPRLGRQVSVKLVVRRLGVFKTAEHLNDSFHVTDFTTPAGGRRTGRRTDVRVTGAGDPTAGRMG